MTKGNLDERYGKWYFIHGTVLLFQKTEEERRNKKNLWMTVKQPFMGSDGIYVIYYCKWDYVWIWRCHTKGQ